MNVRTLIFPAVLSAAVVVAFWAGRRTGPPAGAEEHERERPEAAEHAGDLTLSPEAQRRLGVRFARVESRVLAGAIQATGSVQANGTRLAHIRALARGRIDEVYVRVGDRVRAGQKLLAYDNIELGDAIGEYLSALAELEKAHAEAEVSRRALERARSLVDLGAVARAEFQRREAEHKTALAGVESRKAEAARIEEKLHRFGMNDPEIEKLDPRKDLEYHRERSHSTVTAPLAGVITQLNAAAGETVGPDDELMVLADLSTVWVQADVYEKDIREVRQGQPAEVAVAAYPGRTFRGLVTYSGDVLDPATRTVKVRVEVPNPENLLKLEMFATVRIPGTAARPALVIPAEAVQSVDGRPVAYVREGEQTFEPRALETGRRAGEWIEVLSGLAAGEAVVTEGSFLLKSEAARSELGHHH